MQHPCGAQECGSDRRGVVETGGLHSGALSAGPDRCSWIRCREVIAQCGDHRLSVVFVQAVEHEPVVQQLRCLAEDLAGHVRIDIRSGPSQRLGSGHELLEGGTARIEGKHGGSVATIGSSGQLAPDLLPRLDSNQ